MVGRYREDKQFLDAVTIAELKGEGVPQSMHITGALLAIERKAYPGCLPNAMRLTGSANACQRERAVPVSWSCRRYGAWQKPEAGESSRLSNNGRASRAHQPTLWVITTIVCSKVRSRWPGAKLQSRGGLRGRRAADARVSYAPGSATTRRFAMVLPECGTPAIVGDVAIHRRLLQQEHSEFLAHL